MYKMTIDEEMRFVVQKLIPNPSHKDLSLSVAPLQNPRTISKTDGFNGVQHLRLQPSSLLFQSKILWPGSNWDLAHSSANIKLSARRTNVL